MITLVLATTMAINAPVLEQHQATKDYPTYNPHTSAHVESIIMPGKVTCYRVYGSPQVSCVQDD